MKKFLIKFMLVVAVGLVLYYFTRNSLLDLEVKLSVADVVGGIVGLLLLIAWFLYWYFFRIKPKTETKEEVCIRRYKPKDFL